MILVYGDESMDETKQRVCALAGVVGSGDAWRDLEAKWITRTGDIPFHANDCESDHGDYKGDERHQENQDLYRDLTILLAESGLWGIGVALDLAALRMALPNATDIAYYRAFWQVIDTVEGYASDKGEMAELTFDSRVESDYNATILYGNIREIHPEWKTTLASKLSFESCRANPRIQVADLLARESMKALDNVVGPQKRAVRKSWQALMDTRRFEIHAYSTEFFKNMKIGLDRDRVKIEKRADEYHAWLKDKRRQDNTTNLFVFLGTTGHSIED
jgi:hypothetical protein